MDINCLELSHSSYFSIVNTLSFDTFRSVWEIIFQNSPVSENWCNGWVGGYVAMFHALEVDGVAILFVGVYVERGPGAAFWALATTKQGSK